MATNIIGDGKILSVACTHPATPSSNDPVRYGQLTGIALTDERTDGTTTVDFSRCEAKVSVAGINDAGNSAVAVGDPIYYVDADTPVLSKKISGYLFGVALEAVDAGATKMIKVLHLESNLLGTANIANDSITKAKLAPGTGTKCALVNGGAAGDHVVADIDVGDELIIVLHISTAAAIATMADLTSEFTVADGKITNVGGTDTTDDQLLVIYNDLT